MRKEEKGQKFIQIADIIRRMSNDVVHKVQVSTREVSIDDNGRKKVMVDAA